MSKRIESIGENALFICVAFILFAVCEGRHLESVAATKAAAGEKNAVRTIQKSATHTNTTGDETMGKFSYRYVDVAGRAWQAVELICRGQDSGAPRAAALITTGEGSNLYGFQVDRVQYLYGFGASGDTQKLFGTPVLYPSPNRVRDARFEFAGRVFSFPPNNGRNFIHGLVRDVEWKRNEPATSDAGITLDTKISMIPESNIFSLFPIKNTLELKYTLKENAVRLDFTVRNEDPEKELPFGLAIHPFFPIHGSREKVRLQVPAKKWMEAENLLPSGVLVDLEKGPADLREPVSLSLLNLDDVFWGMEEGKPSVIYYDSIGKKLTLRASAFFTHCVVYTPPGAEYFCIENQSCSTDAHNLHARGFGEAANLTILKPGESLTAWVEMTVSDL